LLNELDNLNPPVALSAIHAAAHDAGFQMSSDLLTGALLRTLVASKPGGNFLELGTGAGAGTAWMLAGMDAQARLLTIENDGSLLAMAQQQLGADARVTFHCAEAGEWLEQIHAQQFDLIFADTWAGKFTHLDEALSLLNRGGLYVIDDLLPQPNWPDGHAPKVESLIASLEQRDDLTLTKFNWSTGIILAARNNWVVAQ
jgi:predicted O-methyltransferase YrrM